MLLVHSDEIDKVEMWEGQDNNRVVVADERQAVTENTIIDVVTDSTNGLR